MARREPVILTQALRIKEFRPVFSWNAEYVQSHLRPRALTLSYEYIDTMRRWLLARQKFDTGKALENAVIGYLGEFALGLIIAQGAYDRGFKSFADGDTKWTSIQSNQNDVSDLNVRGNRIEVKTSADFERWGGVVRTEQMTRILGRSDVIVFMDAQKEYSGDSFTFQFGGWTTPTQLSNECIIERRSFNRTFNAYQHHFLRTPAHFENLIDYLDVDVEYQGEESTWPASTR